MAQVSQPSPSDNEPRLCVTLGIRSDARLEGSALGDDKCNVLHVPWGMDTVGLPTVISSP